MEMYLLKYLVAFAKYGTLSATSENLYISQPSLTRSMQKLEKIFGVKLFTRTKNSIKLNENGKLAVNHAINILQYEQEMINSVRAFDRSQRTVSFGCCAPIPLETILPLMSRYYSDMSIVSELNDDVSLLEGLQNGSYQLIVLHEKPSNDELYFQRCGSEKLFISLPPNSPLINQNGIYLSELEGQTLLLYSKIGFWYDLCFEKIPNAKFLIQNERDTFKKLLDVASVPSFTTDMKIRQGDVSPNRVNIPILDDEANVNYYCVCKVRDKEFFYSFFNSLQNLCKKIEIQLSRHNSSSVNVT